MFGNGGGKGLGFGLGFNLIGLLVVIAILGVSSALALSAFGGGGTTGLTTGSLPGVTATTAAGATTPTTAGATPATSTPTTVAATTGTLAVARAAAVAACESDATDVETAVQAYAAVHGSAADVTPALLAPYLQAFPSSPDYSISVVSGVVMVAAPKTATPVVYDAPNACAQAGA